MHTEVKFLEGMPMKTIIKLLGEYSEIIWGICPPIPPGFRHPWLLVLSLFLAENNEETK